MSIDRSDEITPEWEPSPWGLAENYEVEQGRGFHERAIRRIEWTAIPWKNFPEGGIFGHLRDWLSSVEAQYYATSSDEELLLIDNTWFGWPDPPRWGLVSRPIGQRNSPWQKWGHFPDLPDAWIVPRVDG